MLGKPDHLVAEAPVGLRLDDKRRNLALERVELCRSPSSGALVSVGAGPPGTSTRPRPSGSGSGVAAARDAEAAKTFEVAVAAVDGQGGEIDRDLQIGSRDRPQHRTARPGVAAFEQPGDLAGRVEVEGVGDIAETPADDIGGGRADRVGEFLGNGAEPAFGIGAPDEAGGRGIAIRSRQSGGAAPLPRAQGRQLPPAAGA